MNNQTKIKLPLSDYNIPGYKLNGTKDIMPSFGLGTWLSEKGELERSVKISLLELNQNHIDCASIQNNEEEIGNALNDVFITSKIDRHDIWITSKLWNDCHNHVIEACKESIKKLKCGYLDLQLIHFPISFKYGIKEATSKNHMTDTNIEDTWKAMEELVNTGLVKNIGVSNFEVSDIEKLLKINKIPIAINQIEIHPYQQRTELVKFCKDNNIMIAAHTSLGSPTNPWVDFHPPKLMDDPLILKLSLTYNKSPAQILLRWAHENNYIVIPKSIKRNRLEENYKIFDWKLNLDDFNKINDLDLGENGRFNHPVTPWLGRAGFPDDKPTYKFTQSYPTNFNEKSGIMAATFTIMKDKLNISTTENDIKQYASDLILQGVSGVFVNGTTGESVSLSVEERKYIAEAWCNTIEVASGKLDVIVQVGANSIYDTIELAKHSEELIRNGKCKAIAIKPPQFFIIKNEREMVEQLFQISKPCNFPPMYYYHIPTMTKVNINMQKLFKISKIVLPNLIGAKYTQNDLAELNLATSLGNNFIIGGEDFLFPGLTVGADSAIGISFNFAGELNKKIIECQAKKDQKEARFQQQKCSLLIQEIRQIGDLVPVSKYLCSKLRNINLGPVRQPQFDLDQKTKLKINEKLNYFRALCNPKLPLPKI